MKWNMESQLQNQDLTRVKYDKFGNEYKICEVICKIRDDWMGGKEAKMGVWVARQAVHMKPGWQGWKPGWQDRELGTKETNGSAREQGCSTAALPLFGLLSLALLKKSLYTALQLAVLSSYNVNYALLFSFLST